MPGGSAGPIEGAGGGDGPPAGGGLVRPLGPRFLDLLAIISSATAVCPC